MHNGQISNFDKLRRVLESRLSDDVFALRLGVTDSELMFLLAIEFGLVVDPVGAFKNALAYVNEQAQAKGIATLIRFTACWTDGKDLHAVRFASDDRPPSLYYAQCGRDQSICLVSEPFDHPDRDWTEVPANTHILISKGSAALTPFSPAFNRLEANAAA